MPPRAMAPRTPDKKQKPLKKLKEETLCEFFIRVMKERHIDFETLFQITGLSEATLQKLTTDSYYIPRMEYVFESLFVAFNFTVVEARIFRDIYSEESINYFYKASFASKRKEVMNSVGIKDIKAERQLAIKKLLESNSQLSTKEIADSLIFYKRFSEKTIKRDLKELGFKNTGSRIKPKWEK